MTAVRHLAKESSNTTMIVFECIQSRVVPLQSGRSDSVGLAKWK
jgi:hypothetical protein